MITQERLKELFDYENGEFIRKNNGKKVTASPSRNHRYLRMAVDGKIVFIHRMVFLWHHGYLPKTIDHADGDRNNNHIENLRPATQRQNCLNKKHHSNSKSPYKNVYQQSLKNSKWKSNWVVSLTVNGKRKYLGSFDDLEFADLVATEARNLYHGAFARHI